jgi:hypothetical protein
LLRSGSNGAGGKPPGRGRQVGRSENTAANIVAATRVFAHPDRGVRTEPRVGPLY